MPYTKTDYPDALKGLPELGEIRRGSEIGRPNKFCRYIWHACEICGRTRWVQFYNGKPCSTRCLNCANHELGRSKRGSDNPSWKGGRFRDGRGYILVRVQPDDFFYPMTSRGTVYEHRLIVAKSLNRCLLPWEIVHHRNGIKDDNGLENLQLLPNRRFHMVDTQAKRHIGKLEHKISDLEGRVIQLEAELVLVRGGNNNALYVK